MSKSMRVVWCFVTKRVITAGPDVEVSLFDTHWLYIYTTDSPVLPWKISSCGQTPYYAQTNTVPEEVQLAALIYE